MIEHKKTGFFWGKQIKYLSGGYRHGMDTVNQ